MFRWVPSPFAAVKPDCVASVEAADPIDDGTRSGNGIDCDAQIAQEGLVGAGDHAPRLELEIVEIIMCQWIEIIVKVKVRVIEKRAAEEFEG